VKTDAIDIESHRVAVRYFELRHDARARATAPRSVLGPDDRIILDDDSMTTSKRARSAWCRRRLYSRLLSRVRRRDLQIQSAESRIEILQSSERACKGRAYFSAEPRP
jgi:hypothetical protein